MVPGRTTPRLEEVSPRRSIAWGDEDASPAAGDSPALPGFALGRQGRRERGGEGGGWRRLGFSPPVATRGREEGTST